MKLIDITRPVYTAMPVWPGDTPVEFAHVATKANGASVNLGRLAQSVHAGTHADAPYHYNDAGKRIDELPLDLFIGPARVVDARGRTSIDPAFLGTVDFSGTPRVLFRTDTWTDMNSFPTSWPLLSLDAPAWLAARGVRLVGMDVPSVDTIESKDLPIHHAIDRAGIVILENLDLTRTEPGVYELLAQPLRIRNGDGSPIRAVLRSA